MSSSGSFPFASAVDARIDAHGAVAVIPAASNAIQTLTPPATSSGFTAFNYSSQWIRGLLTISGNSPAAAGNLSFIIPPGGNYDANYENGAATTGYISAVSVQAVSAPTATVQTNVGLTAPANFTGSPDAIVAVNFIVA